MAVSQGGKSFSTIEALKKAKEFGVKNIFVMTSNLKSPITECADHVIDIGCGEETAGFVTMGMISTILTIMLMGVEAAYALNKIDSVRYEAEIRKLHKDHRDHKMRYACL